MKKVLLSSLITISLLAGCATYNQNASQEPGAAGKLSGSEYGSPELTIQERHEQQRQILEMQQGELKRQDQEVEDLRRQRQHNDQLRRFEK